MKLWNSQRLDGNRSREPSFGIPTVSSPIYRDFFGGVTHQPGSPLVPRETTGPATGAGGSSR